jgi:hypothetical protein
MQRLLHSLVMLAAAGATGHMPSDGVLLRSVVHIVAGPQGDVALCLFAVHGRDQG